MILPRSFSNQTDVIKRRNGFPSLFSNVQLVHFEPSLCWREQSLSLPFLSSCEPRSSTVDLRHSLKVNLNSVEIEILKRTKENWTDLKVYQIYSSWRVTFDSDVCVTPKWISSLYGPCSFYANRCPRSNCLDEMDISNNYCWRELNINCQSCLTHKNQWKYDASFLFTFV